MRYIVKKLSIYMFYTLLFSFYSASRIVYADLLDTAFQPSRNLDQVINIGNSKNAVGNEVFRGSTSVIADAGITKKCFKPTGESRSSCSGKK